MSTLRTAKITGFFSLPSPSLAEHNPAAYNAAMAGAPAGAGTCSHCGVGIRHHVVIVDETGTRRFVGTQCAAKVGCDPELVRNRMTSEEQAARAARRAAAQDAYRQRQEQEQEQERIRLALRREQVGDLIDLLRSQQTEFHASLASQLEHGPLSHRQAHYVTKLTSDTGRRNRRNAAAWDDTMDRCTRATDDFD